MADSEGVQGVPSNPPPPFIYPMKISDTKLFHFYGISKKNEIN